MNKVAFITGSSTGIGKGIALRLAREGCDVVIHYGHDDKKAEDTGREISALGVKTLVLKADVTDLDQLNAAFDQAIETFGKIDILVNNTGITQYRPFLEVTPDFYERIFRTNLRSHFFASQRAAKNMIANHIHGSIVTVTSIQQEIYYPEASVYGSLKAALLKFTKHLALELAPYGIRSNAIAPGTIKVYPNPFDPNEMFTDREKQLIERTPITRVGWPEDIAGAAAFLCSDEASYITGACINVSGGAELPSVLDNTFCERVMPVFK